MTIKFLKKAKKKKNYFGAIFGPFYLNLGKKELSWKKVLSVSFQIFELSIIAPKIRKTIQPFLRKMPH